MADSGTDWQGVALAITAAGTIVTAVMVPFLTYLTSRNNTKVNAVVATVTAVAEKVAKVETNTNSMSERLERQAHLAGVAQGVTDEKARANSITQGVAVGVAAAAAKPG